MLKSYQTLSAPAQGEFKDKGSKFMAYAFPVKSEDGCKKIIESAREEHPKSRHVCYAFRVGIENIVERNHDAGEPSGTAGKPILGQIHSFGLHNILVIVVRYFGGTLLGIPGLIQAYKTAAEQAFSNGKIITKQTLAIYELRFEYPAYNELMNYLKKENVDFRENEMGEKCRVIIGIDVEKNSRFANNLSNFKNIHYEFLKYE